VRFSYQLYLKTQGNSWDWIGTFDAATHADAFRMALLSLGPGDERRPIRVEQDIDGAYRKPLRQKDYLPAAVRESGGVGRLHR
jgi:hypothetical protein